MAGQFMLQAVIEEYLRNGAFGSESFNTIFAFGCPGTEAQSDEGSDVEAMRSIFCDNADPHKQIHGWSRLKREYISEVILFYKCTISNYCVHVLISFSFCPLLDLQFPLSKLSDWPKKNIHTHDSKHRYWIICVISI